MPPGYGVPPAAPRFDPTDPLVSSDFAGWWRRGFAIVRSGWRPITRLQLIINIPLLFLLAPAQTVANLSQADAMRSAEAGGAPSFAGLGAAFGVLAVTVVMVAVAQGFGTLATARLVVAVATGGHAGARQTLRDVLPRVPALLGWYVVVGLISLGALLACFLPVLYVAAVFVILPVVVLAERGDAVGRCFSLFHADLGVAVGRIATIFGLGLAGAAVLAGLDFGASVAVHGGLVPEPSALSRDAVVAQTVLTSVLDTAYYTLSGVVLTPLIVAAYADMRARREAFGTADLVRDLGSRDGSAQPPESRPYT
ncbi:MAG TPA: hypothetical protein VNV66_19665 [Pilimelia sp.]|nr:hypothetical protein [Pilimelia sp.]